MRAAVFAKLELLEQEKAAHESDAPAMSCGWCQNFNATCRRRDFKLKWVPVCEICAAKSDSGSPIPSTKTCADFLNVPDSGEGHSPPNASDLHEHLRSTRPLVNFVHGEVTFGMMERVLTDPMVAAQPGER
jgi:hypothetical protein